MSHYTELVKDLRLYMNDGTDELRRKAADAIEALQRACTNYAEQNEELQQEYDSIAKSFNEAAELLHNRQPKWIPVTERLPEEPGDYLVYVVVGEWQQLSWIYIDYFNGEKFRGGKWTTANHVSWMPLPEPPKGET